MVSSLRFTSLFIFLATLITIFTSLFVGLRQIVWNSVKLQTQVENLVIPRYAGVELCYINWKNVRRNCRKYWKKGKTCSLPRHSKGRQVTGSQQRVASLASSGLPRYTARKFARRGGPFCTSGQNASSSGVISHGRGFLAPPTWRWMLLRTTSVNLHSEGKEMNKIVDKVKREKRKSSKRNIPG